jgi:hypothetical protein
MSVSKRKLRLFSKSEPTAGALVSGCLLSLLLCSCSSGPLDRKEIQETARQPRIAKSIFLQVTCSGTEKETYGSGEAWEEELSEILFKEMQTCEMIWHSGEVDESEADVTLKVIVASRKDAEPPEILGQLAFLDILAWLCIPFSSLLVADVAVAPAVSVTIEFANENYPEVPLARVSTCLTERYPLLSWPTAGSIILPAFVYSGGDAEHLAATLAQRIHLECAAEIAKKIKDRFAAQREQELLSGLRVENSNGQTWLHLRASANVSMYEVRPDRTDRNPERKYLRLDRSEADEQFFLLPPEFSKANLLRIQATNKITGGLMRYTIAIPRRAEVNS